MIYIFYLMQNLIETFGDLIYNIRDLYKGGFRVKAIYVEKPDMAKKIADALHEGTAGNIGKKSNGYYEITYKGEQNIVTWGYGHMCELKQAFDYNPEYRKWSNMPLPFIPEYEIKYMDDKTQQIKVIYGLFKKADLIINATDADREGNLIFYYLYSKLKIDVPYIRVWNQAATDEGIREAFETPLEADKDERLTQAGRARSVADWVIGSNLTAAMTLGFSSGKQILSVGRVQTPTLKLFVDREKAIRNFSKNKYFVPVGTFTTEKGETYKGEPEKKYERKEDIPSFSGEGIITSIKRELQKKNTPHLYSLSSLQMAANSRYGITVEDTLSTAQSLYEKGFTTYPRTDSQYLNEDMVEKVNGVLRKLSLSFPEYKKLLEGRKPVKFTKYHFDDKKVTGHYAIIPTGNIPKNLNPTEEKIYDLVCRSLITMVYFQAELEKTTVTTAVGDTDFITHGSVIKKAEWLSVMGSPKEKFLPELCEGEKVTVQIEVCERESKPPAPYDDASIIKAMITCGKDIQNDELREILARTGMQGIGRESTRAAIIKTLLSRGYIERNKKQLRATDMGIALIDSIPIEDVKSPVLTAEWEKRLDMIASGEDTYDGFIKDIEESLKVWCSDITSAPRTYVISSLIKSGGSAGSCPKCRKPVVKKNWGWGCTGWQKDGGGCDFGISETIAKKKITDAQVKKLLSSGETGLIKGFTNKSGEKFDAKLKIGKDFKVVFEFESKEQKQ